MRLARCLPVGDFYNQLTNFGGLPACSCVFFNRFIMKGPTSFFSCVQIRMKKMTKIGRGRSYDNFDFSYDYSDAR